MRILQCNSSRSPSVFFPLSFSGFIQQLVVLLFSLLIFVTRLLSGSSALVFGVHLIAAGRAGSPPVDDSMLGGWLPAGGIKCLFSDSPETQGRHFSRQDRRRRCCCCCCSWLPFARSSLVSNCLPSHSRNEDKMHDAVSPAAASNRLQLARI